MHDTRAEGNRAGKLSGGRTWIGRSEVQGSFRIYCKYNNLVQLLYRLYERAYYLVVASERGDDDYVHTSLSTCSPHSEESTAQHVRQRDHLVTLHFVTCYICLRSESVRHADLARVSTYGVYIARVYLFLYFCIWFLITYHCNRRLDCVRVRPFPLLTDHRCG